MDIKSILGKIMGGIIVDKNNAHNHAKKLNFDLYLKQCYNPLLSNEDLDFIESPGKSQYKFQINQNLIGPISIIIIYRNNAIKVHCSENTKIKEIFDCNFSFNLLFGNIIFSYQKIKEKTLKDLNLHLLNHILIRIPINYCPGGVEEFILEDDLLDPSYDYDFRNINDENKKFYRGGLEYKRPCGWKRYALKVKDKYENDKWLGCSGGDSEWAVSYHGTKQDFVKSIYDNGYRVGNRNSYGKGVYCSPNIETAARYSRIFTDNNGKKYKIVLQNRVRPSAIKKASDKGGLADYWYIEDGKDIRPYSICVKQY